MNLLAAGILAGGKSTRMGEDKAMLLYKEQTLLQHAIDLLTPFGKRLYVSSNVTYTDLKVPIVFDSIKDIGPIGGIYSLLKEIKTQKLILTAVDTPLLTPKIIQYLLDNYDEKAKITVLKTTDGLQMLVGIYDTSLVPIIEKQIAKKDYKLAHLIDYAKTQILDATAFSDSFINVNTKGEFKKIMDAANNFKQGLNEH